MVFQVPFQAMVEQALISAEQERAGAAGHVQHAERLAVLAAGELRRALALDLLADGVLDDVVDDVGGSVVDAAGLAHLGFFLDLGLVPGGQADDLAQEALVDRAQDLHGQDAEVVGRAVLEIEALQDGLEHLVVDLSDSGVSGRAIRRPRLPSGSGTGRNCISRRPCGTGRS